MKHPSVALFASSIALLVAACATTNDQTGTPATGGTGGGVDAGKDSASGGSSGSGGSGGSGGTAGAAGSAGAAGADAGSDAGTTAVSGTIVALVDLTTPVAGLQVCVYGDSSIPCVQTDSSGAYTITGVPADQEILLEYTKATYFPSLVTVKTRTSPIDIGEFPAPTEQEANVFAAIVGITIDKTKAQVLATAVQPGSTGGFIGQDGVTVSLAPQSGTGPYFTNSSNLPDTSLTSTSTSGLGLFANVNPGDPEITFIRPGKSCTPHDMAWPGTAANSVRIKTVAGYLVGGGAVQCN